MPVLARIGERFARERPLAGVGVGMCLHVTAETAHLVRVLVAGGADVALCAANPLSTQDDVAAALVDRDGVEVHAVHGETLDRYAEHVAALVTREPQVTLDDGADLITVLHDARPDAAARMIGATEETTTGLVRLRAMEAEGRLLCPVVAVNEARTERAFNDRYGTGQSTLDGIIRATNVLLAGSTVVVLGYGSRRGRDDREHQEDGRRAARSHEKRVARGAPAGDSRGGRGPGRYRLTAASGRRNSSHAKYSNP